MRQRMWRSILALSIGAVISATASAQAPAAQAPAAPAAQAAPATAAPVVAVSTSGCSGCGKAASSCDSCGKGSKHGAGLFRIGEGCASTAGCSSCKQERTFLWGSCHQFFNAGNDCGNGKLHGPRAPWAPCTYGSYHHR